MTKLTRLWRAFEQPYGIRGVRAHWYRLLGEELTPASPFLRRSKETSTTYPCPHRGGDGCPRRVLIRGPEDIVAVCGCAAKACDAVKLNADDIAVAEFDWRRFCEFLSESLGLVSVAEPVEARNGIWHIGSWTVSPTDHRPVFLVASPSRSSFDGAVGVLVISYQGPFVVLAPTLRFSGASATQGLTQRVAALLALEDIVRCSNEGRLVTAGKMADVVGNRSKVTVAPAERNLFRREHDTWMIAFNGKSIRLTHLAGLAYIAEILRVPGREIEAFALIQHSADEGPVSAASLGIARADETAIKQVRSELERRKVELAQLAPNDWVRKGDLTAEIQQLVGYLREVQGLHGRSRKSGGAGDRARLAVKNALARAILRIESEHPDLAQHLKDSIRTGTTLLYAPLQMTEWTF